MLMQKIFVVAFILGFLGGSMVKNSPAKQEMRV